MARQLLARKTSQRVAGSASRTGFENSLLPFPEMGRKFMCREGRFVVFPLRARLRYLRQLDRGYEGSPQGTTSIVNTEFHSRERGEIRVGKTPGRRLPVYDFSQTLRPEHFNCLLLRRLVLKKRRETAVCCSKNQRNVRRSFHAEYVHGELLLFSERGIVMSCAVGIVFACGLPEVVSSVHFMGLPEVVSSLGTICLFCGIMSFL